MAVEWLAWRGKVHYHSVLPYNRLIAMTESDFFFKVMGDTDSYTCCYEGTPFIGCSAHHPVFRVEADSGELRRQKVRDGQHLKCSQEGVHQVQ